MKKSWEFWITLGLLPSLSIAALQTPKPHQKQMSDQLSEIRSRIMNLEEKIIESLKTQKNAKSSLKQIQTLTRLQEQERTIGHSRLKELEKTILSLEEQQTSLRSKIEKEENSIRKALQDIEHSANDVSKTLILPEREKTEAPRRKFLSLWINRSLVEIKAYRRDLLDLESLEKKIQDQKQNLAYLIQDLKEQEGILEFNRQLQIDLLQKKHQERLAQLERYRALKNSEKAVERMIHDFSVREELEQLAHDSPTGTFNQLKGKLPFPLQGKVQSQFGRTLDSKSNLFVFKKGIEIAPNKGKEIIRAIFPGTVVFAGELPSYGKVAIIDHGEHFYSLCGRMGDTQRKTGEKISSGDPVGTADDAGAPIYFEIRSRNIAVNPLQWLSN